MGLSTAARKNILKITKLKERSLQEAIDHNCLKFDFIVLFFNSRNDFFSWKKGINSSKHYGRFASPTPGI
jgi:hypothetical protein